MQRSPEGQEDNLQTQNPAPSTPTIDMKMTEKLSKTISTIWNLPPVNAIFKRRPGESDLKAAQEWLVWPFSSLLSNLWVTFTGAPKVTFESLFFVSLIFFGIWGVCRATSGSQLFGQTTNNIVTTSETECPKSEQLEWRHLFYRGTPKSSRNKKNTLRTFPLVRNFPCLLKWQRTS